MFIVKAESTSLLGFPSWWGWNCDCDDRVIQSGDPETLLEILSAAQRQANNQFLVTRETKLTLQGWKVDAVENQ